MAQLPIQKLKTDKTGCQFRHPVPLCFQKSNVLVCGGSADVADPCEFRHIQLLALVGGIVAKEGGGDDIITKEGFNKKQTETIIVLHNLRPVPYALHIETEDGLRPISTEEARGNKKLFESWI